MKSTAGPKRAVGRLFILGILLGLFVASCSKTSTGSSVTPQPAPSGVAVASGGSGACSVLTGIVVVRSGCSASPSPGGSAGAAGSSGTQYVIYWELENQDVSQIPAGTTIVILAFGGISGNSVTDIGGSAASTVSALHQKNIKVLLSLGGGGGTFAFDQSSTGLSTFTTSLKALVAKDGYDGVDFDDENESDPNKRESDLVMLIPAARTALGPSAIITLAAYGDPTYQKDGAVVQSSSVASALSFVNVMSYAGSDVSTTEGYVTSFAPYLTASMTKSKLLLGVDFDGDQGGPPSAASLQQMAAWVKSGGYGGMMAWQVSSAESSGSGILSGIATDLGL